jgi:hypothetical protein
MVTGNTDPLYVQSHIGEHTLGNLSVIRDLKDAKDVIRYSDYDTAVTASTIMFPYSSQYRWTIM